MVSQLFKPLNILLVDDDEDLLHLMQYKLRSEGFRVNISHNGEDIWQKIQDFTPDIILLDVQMGGADGSVICSLLKNNPLTSNIPVIMFSSCVDLNQISDRCGANGFIPKSIPADQLKSRLMHLYQ